MESGFLSVLHVRSHQVVHAQLIHGELFSKISQRKQEGKYTDNLLKIEAAKNGFCRGRAADK